MCPCSVYFIVHTDETMTLKQSQHLEKIEADGLRLFKSSNQTLSTESFEYVLQKVKCDDDLRDALTNIEIKLTKSDEVFLAGHPDFAIWFECFPAIPPDLSILLWGSNCVKEDLSLLGFASNKKQEDENNDEAIKEELIPEIKREIMDSNEEVKDLRNDLWVPKEDVTVFENDVTKNKLKGKNINSRRSKNNEIKFSFDDEFTSSRTKSLREEINFVQSISKDDPTLPLYAVDDFVIEPNKYMRHLLSHHFEIISFAPVNQVLLLQIFPPKFELRCSNKENNHTNDQFSNASHFESLGEVLCSKKLVLYFKHVASGEVGFIQCLKMSNGELKFFCNFFNYKNKIFVHTSTGTSQKPHRKSEELLADNVNKGNTATSKRQCWLSNGAFKNELNKLSRFLPYPDKYRKAKIALSRLSEYAKTISCFEEINKAVQMLAAAHLSGSTTKFEKEHLIFMEELKSKGLMSEKI
uniref:Uncharacterized protein n=1 Tax=Rhabditophanes sp. KR3021 TaxID=114890 RepID=A0AC35UIC6_9BILA